MSRVDPAGFNRGPLTRWLPVLGQAAPEPPDARSGDCQVHFQIPVELPALLGVHQGGGDGRGFAGFEWLIAERRQHAINARTRRCAGREEQIRAVFLRQY